MMVSKTHQRRKKQKSELERKRKISKEFTASHTKKKVGGLSGRDRLELAQSRSGAGQEHKMKDGKIISTTSEERRQSEITATAQKGLDIEAEKRRLQLAPDEDTPKMGLHYVIGEEDTSEKQGLISRGLDVLSAPLSKPGTTFKEGIGAGATAVKESREQISAGDKGEAASVALTTATSTAVLVGALLTGTGAAQAFVKGVTLKGGAATGLKTAGVGLAILYGVNEVFYSPSELGTWAAVDNVAGALSFQISELDNGVRDGIISPSEARETINVTMETIGNMRLYVNRQVERNPKLWASSKVFNQALDVAEGRVLQIEVQIFGNN